MEPKRRKLDKDQLAEQSTSRKAAPVRDQLSTSTATASTSPDADGKSLSTIKLPSS